MSTPWEEFLREHFPGYLLPHSHRARIGVDEATRFLERLTGEPRALSRLLGTSLLAGHLEELRRFALDSLPRLVRELTGRTEVYPKTWEGGFQGRLDVRGTLLRHLAGEETRFITRARRRRFDLPEQILVRMTVQRLLGLLAELRLAGVTAHHGWSAEVQAYEGQLEHLLKSTVLREVPEERPGAFHLRAAELARHDAYHLARDWHLYLEALNARDPEQLARLLAEGALVPLKDYTRFELAVAIQLMRALEARLERVQPGRWTLRRTLVVPDRDELAEFRREDGAWVRLFYNQAILASGAAEAGARHYLNQGGRMRPDLTLLVHPPGGPERATVVEIKHSSNPETLLAGYKEAQLYRWEYAERLTGWPKAVLVSSGPIERPPQRSDDVIAVDWAHWVPEEVLEGLLAGL
ncbi:hypothetical protein [Archangium primigenium]|uniref:hypothetical protein n=1 Tax=[Archangium] primigenium TaxID=2792470 RepID=UPI0019568F7D|nr:hypothetical protein [Archangium primigenium]MBM7112459.1 hypothetical protein [Archangium primigenium]